jgi:hypothetical protein
MVRFSLTVDGLSVAHTGSVLMVILMDGCIYCTLMLGKSLL